MIRLAKKLQYQMWKKKKRERFVLKNGAEMLKKCIEIFNGKRNPIRNFSEEEIARITNNYDTRKLVHKVPNFSMYEGKNESRSVLVKKFDEFSYGMVGVSNEIAIASNMSSHSNFLKLLGCCLETKIPVLVYEFGVNLSMEIINSLPWETKLRIANEIANAGAYLHYGTSRVIIHRDIRIDHIFLNHDNIAKLSEFQISVPIPLGKTHVEPPIMGIVGDIAPDVWMTGRLTEKSDVLSFGILLMEFLIGKSERDWIDLIFDETVNCDSACYDGVLLHALKGENRRHVIEFGELALKCIQTNPYARPTMVEIAQALGSIRKML